MIYALLGISLLVSLFYLSSEKKKRVKAEVELRRINNPNGWHTNEQDYVNGPYWCHVNDNGKDRVYGPILHGALLIPHPYGKEVAALLNLESKRGK